MATPVTGLLAAAHRSGDLTAVHGNNGGPESQVLIGPYWTRNRFIQVIDNGD
jgi:hypothetical protein